MHIILRRRDLLYKRPEYLRFTAKTACQFKFIGTTVNDTLNTLEYSTDWGSTWDVLPDDTYITVGVNENVLFRGNCIPLSNTTTGGIGQFASSSGTFVKAASMNDWTSGVDGIPSNWTVVDAT